MENNLLSRALSKRTRYELLRSQLEQERDSFKAHWRDLGDYILPRRPRFFISDTNKGDRRNTKIIDSTATLAARTLRSGMMGGVTSPSRPWFRLTTPDPDFAEFGPVKEWLHVVSQRMSTAFLRSNVYNALPIVYGDMGVFGTAAMSIEEDLDDVIRCYPFPIGSYMIATNDKMKVDVFFREFRMTVRQIVDKFGKTTAAGKPDWSNFSELVQNQYNLGQLETWVDVCHVIHPNQDYNANSADPKHKKFSSCYYERGTSGATTQNYMSNDDRYLRESGFDFFPVLAPRWEVTGEDVYGTSCPGMEALGDTKQLQTGEKRGSQAIDKMVNPPMTAPTALRTTKTSILPGDITYLDVREGQQGFRPAHEVNFRLEALENKQAQVRERVRRAFYEDLFLMLSTSDRREITAREIEERHEEKLLALGPVLEQLNQDLLDPLIDNTFEIMLRQGMIPEPPEELQGMKLKVEYISVMAQAQKLVGIASLERFAGFVGNLIAQTKDPSTLDKVDIDQMIDEYGDALSVPPRIVRPDDQVDEIRAQRAKAVQAQQQAENLREMAGGAKDLAGADMSGDNALTRVIKGASAGQMVPTV